MVAKISKISNFKRKADQVDICKLEFEIFRNQAGILVKPKDIWCLKETVDALTIQVGDDTDI